MLYHIITQYNLNLQMLYVNISIKLEKKHGIVSGRERQLANRIKRAERKPCINKTHI